ncbi:MAG TPA: hypothetical protein VN812_08525 [Candidatus Acidoferrales bacterium]|nr:hypothetical protein [Candidatus Acidoferrales bacterium]
MLLWHKEELERTVPLHMVSHRKLSAHTQALLAGRRRTRVTIQLLVVVVTMASVGCDRLPFGYTSIGDVVRKAGSYEGKTVKLRGTVTDVVQLPLAEIRYYVLRQDDAEVVVFARENVPASGDEVSVVGTVSSVAIVGATSIGLHLTEQRRW